MLVNATVGGRQLYRQENPSATTLQVSIRELNLHSNAQISWHLPHKLDKPRKLEPLTIKQLEESKRYYICQCRHPAAAAPESDFSFVPDSINLAAAAGGHNMKK